MARETFLADIEVTGAITKHIATEDFTGNNYYYAAKVKQPPTFALEGEGFISGNFGTMTIVHDPDDEETVFTYADGTWPLTLKAYPISFRWGEQSTDLFNGIAVVRKIADTEIEFDLVKPQYTNDLLEWTQDDSRVTVDSVQDNGAGLVQVNSTNHGLSTSNQVIFEGMTTSTLDYNPSTNPTPYIITVVDANTFTLNGSSASSHGLTGIPTAETGTVGVPVQRPMAFGFVRHRLPIQKSATILNNPHFDKDEIIRVYEDGVQIAAGKNGGSQINVSAVTAATTTTYTVSSHNFRVGDDLTPADVDGSNKYDDPLYKVAQNVISVTTTTIITDLNSSGYTNTLTGTPVIDFTNAFGTNPTDDEITLNGATTGGELSVSGTSVNAITLSGFFTYVCSTLSFTLNTSKATGASSQSIAFYIEAQEKVIDLADIVAQKFNYQFYISGSTLYLIDLVNNPTATEVDDTVIDQIVVDRKFPVKRLESIYDLRVPFTGTAKRLGTETRRVSVNSSNFDGTGTITRVDPFLENREAQRLVLTSMLTIIERSQIVLIKSEIDFTTAIGDKLTFDDENKKLAISMYVRAIQYDFRNEKTEIRGDGTFAILTRS